MVCSSVLHKENSGEMNCLTKRKELGFTEIKLESLVPLQKPLLEVTVLS